MSIPERELEEIEKGARLTLASKPLSQVSAAKLQNMVITGEGDTPDPFMDAVVEMGRRSEEHGHLAQTLLLMIAEVRRSHAEDAELRERVGELEPRLDRLAQMAEEAWDGIISCDDQVSRALDVLEEIKDVANEANAAFSPANAQAKLDNQEEEAEA